MDHDSVFRAAGILRVGDICRRSFADQQANSRQLKLTCLVTVMLTTDDCRYECDRSSQQMGGGDGRKKEYLKSGPSAKVLSSVSSSPSPL